MEDGGAFDNNIMHQILSRLPARTAAQLSCTCKRWRRIIANSYFLTDQAARSIDRVLGLLHVSLFSGELHYLPLDGPTRVAPYTSSTLGQISILAACNGIIFCRLFRTRRYVIGNPTTKSFLLIPAPNRMATRFGLVFDPSTMPATRLKIVGICYSVSRSAVSFVVYHAENNRWCMSNIKKSMISCPKPALVPSPNAVFFRGWLHWLTTDGGIIAFNVEKEISSYTMRLPAPTLAGCVTWFGVVKGRLTVLKYDGRCIHIWDADEADINGEGMWKLNKRIDVIGQHAIDVPVFYDGERCVFSGRGEHNRMIKEYVIKSREWKGLMTLDAQMDGYRYFFPHISHMITVSKIAPDCKPEDILPL